MKSLLALSLLLLLLPAFSSSAVTGGWTCSNYEGHSCVSPKLLSMDRGDSVTFHWYTNSSQFHHWYLIIYCFQYCLSGTSYLIFKGTILTNHEYTKTISYSSLPSGRWFGYVELCSTPSCHSGPGLNDTIDWT